MNRVVITGLGMINALGMDKESSFKAIVDGKCGIKSITLFDTTNHSVTIAGEISDFDPSTVMNAKEVKKADRFIQLGIKAAAEAMEDAAFESFDGERFGISSASGIGGLPNIEKNSVVAHTRGPRRISPFFIPPFLSICCRWFSPLIWEKAVRTYRILYNHQTFSHTSLLPNIS